MTDIIKPVLQPVADLLDEAFDIDRGGAVVFGGLTAFTVGLVVLGAYEAWSLWTGKAPPITWMVRSAAEQRPRRWAGITLAFGTGVGLLAGHFFWGGYQPLEKMMP